MPITMTSSGGLSRHVLLTQLVITQAKNHHWKSTQINKKILITFSEIRMFWQKYVHTGNGN